MDLDELDTAILRELQSDARKTNREVAAAVGVSPTTALDRTRALRQLSTAELRRLTRLLAASTDLHQVAQAIITDLQHHLPAEQTTDGL